MIFKTKIQKKEFIVELNQAQKPNPNVAQSLSQPRPQQEQKPQEKKPLSENAKLVQELKKFSRS